MPSRLAVALLGISFVSGSGNPQPPTAAGPEHFEIRGADGKVVIAADDVLAYEWASHTLTLKPKIRKNLFDKLKGNLVHGEPFIVSVGSKVVYQGNWKSVCSSISCRTPVIVLDGLAVDPKLEEDQVRIELGYPSKDFFKGEDPRGDQRVRNALKASGKLKQGSPMEQPPRTLEKPQSEKRPAEAERRPSPSSESVAGCAAVAQQQAQPIKTELKLKNTRFRADTPIIVDVWVENQTEQDIERNQFSPISSSVGLPSFVIVRVPDGKDFSIPPGLYGDDWDQWYQPVSGKKALSVGGFSLPSAKRIHLLHGDLRLTVVHAREHCQRALDEKSWLERPDNANTKKSYQEIVRSADDFLSGGTFDICVRAYSKSQTIRITVDKKD